MAFNNLIQRSDGQALIPEEVANEVLNGVIRESASLTLFPRVTISTNQQRVPVLASLPTAFFVAQDTGLKQTTSMAWTNKFLNVEELAVIVPIPEAVLDDMSFDVWGEIRPRMEEAIGRAVDNAVFFGVGKPASWPTAIATAAAAATGNFITRGTAAAAAGGVAKDISDVLAGIEADGYDCNGFVAARSLKAVLRAARDTTGQKLLDVSTDAIEGSPIVYPMRGLFPGTSGTAELFAGEWGQFMLGVRKDMTYKILDQAVITDNNGNIIFNLPQQDMVALRVVFRVAWQVANIINYDNQTEATRYPVAILKAP